MKTKTKVTIGFILLLAATLVLLGMYSSREYGAASAREAREKRLQAELKAADAITDDAAAIAALKKLSPALPEIQLHIVQRQWKSALELLQYMQRARENSELRDQMGAYGARLKIVLDEMIERCGSTLANTPTLRPEIAWQLYNTSGSAKVLNALVMLETEQNVDKVQGVMREALSDYKSAIEAVDKAGVPPLQENIPRWNFEVLHGEENVQKFEVSTDSQKNQALKENLETLIPEIGGYAPGEPIETIVKK